MKRIGAAGILIGVVSVALALAPSSRALADAAPPPPDPGNTIQNNGQNTHVQMVAEDVLITVTDDQAVIHATFQMRNQGTQTEAFDVWFPDGVYNEMFARVDYPIRDFSAAVDGTPAVIGRSVTYRTIPNCEGTCAPVEVPWSTWPATFPPAQTVMLSVDYVLPAGRNYSEAFDQYAYVLSTGAGWFGAIGHGRITIRLPYDVTSENVLLDADDPYFKLQPAGYTIAGTDIVWQFDNLEPTDDNNIGIAVMQPKLWRAVVAAQKDVDATPDSVEANAALARALANALNVVRGMGFLLSFDSSVAMYNRAVGEYKRVVEMAPDNIDYRLSYLSLLARPFQNDQFCPEMVSALVHFPDEPRLHDPDRFAGSCGSYPSLVVLAQETISPAPTMTEAPAVTLTATWPTDTPTMSPSPTVTAAPAPLPLAHTAGSNETLSLIAGGVILAAAIGVWWLYRRSST